MTRPDEVPGLRRGASRPGAASTGERRDRHVAREKPFAELVRDFVRDLSILIDRQIALARHEASRAAAAAGRGAAIVAAGGLVALVGLVYLVLAAVHLLTRVMPDWAAAGAAGLVLVVAGAIVLAAGARTLRSVRVAPRATVETLKEDREWIRRQIRSSAR